VNESISAMASRRSIPFLATNILALCIAVSVAVFLAVRQTPNNSIPPESIDAVATRLAAHSSAASITEVLQRDDSYIRSLEHIIRTQHTLAFSVVLLFAVIAILNLFSLFNAPKPKTRNA
jgi:hypothetical protein